MGNLAVGGGLLTVALYVVLVVVAEATGRVAGGVFVLLVMLLAVARLGALLMPRYADASPGACLPVIRDN
jgi:hypothetical protein